jgi:hypothetical protein
VRGKREGRGGQRMGVPPGFTMHSWLETCQVPPSRAPVCLPPLPCAPHPTATKTRTRARSPSQVRARQACLQRHLAHQAGRLLSICRLPPRVLDGCRRRQAPMHAQAAGSARLP